MEVAVQLSVHKYWIILFLRKMYSNLNKIRRFLPEDGKIFEVRAVIKSFSNGFLAIALPQLAGELEMLRPKKVNLDLFWRQELLVAKNRLTIRRFIKRLKKKIFI